jgi:hypothetical protein
MLKTDPTVAMLAAADQAPVATPLGRDLVERGAASLEAVPGDIAQLPLFQHLAAVMPVADMLLGGAMLVLIMLVHATGVRGVTSRVVYRSQHILQRPAMWRADLLMSEGVFMLLALHVLEIFLWASALVYMGLIPSWRIAGFFAGNTYTTVGYGSMVLPIGWEMLAPLIAISGLFTFGWSGSVLVDLVRRCQEIKDAAVNRLAEAPASRKQGRRTGGAR